MIEQFANLLMSDNYSMIDDANTRAWATFYGNLLVRQQRLGPEFETVLFENVWNLYAREVAE